MRSTLFHVPLSIAGLPVFGFGLLLWIWLAVGLAILWRLLRRRGFDAEARSHVVLVLVIGALIWVVLPRLCDPQGLPIRGYGVMVLLGVIAAVALAAWRAPRRGIDPEVVVSLAFWVFVPGIIGARLFYLIRYWPEIRVLDSSGALALGGTLANAINLAQGGLVIYGGFLGGIGGLVVFVIKEKLPALRLFDLVAPSFLLGLAIGRIGCFLNGCCFGGVCDLPWAVRFPAGSPPYFHQVEHGELFIAGLKLRADPAGRPQIAQVEPGSPAERAGARAGQVLDAVRGKPVSSVVEARWELWRAETAGTELVLHVSGRREPLRYRAAGPSRSLPVHPTQLYSALNAVVLCLFLLAFDRFRRRDGQVLALLLILYPTTRFLLEIIRDDESALVRIAGTGFTTAQVVSVPLVAAGLMLLAYTMLRPTRRPGTQV